LRAGLRARRLPLEITTAARFRRAPAARPGHCQAGVGCFPLHAGTENLRTLRWREPDSNRRSHWMGVASEADCAAAGD
jgi:hypothetical protein